MPVGEYRFGGLGGLLSLVVEVGALGGGLAAGDGAEIEVAEFEFVDGDVGGHGDDFASERGG